MYVSEISTRLSRGMSTPAILAMFPSIDVGAIPCGCPVVPSCSQRYPQGVSLHSPSPAFVYALDPCYRSPSQYVCGGLPCSSHNAVLLRHALSWFALLIDRINAKCKRLGKGCIQESFAFSFILCLSCWVSIREYVADEKKRNGEE